MGGLPKVEHFMKVCVKIILCFLKLFQKTQGASPAFQSNFEDKKTRQVKRLIQTWVQNLKQHKGQSQHLDQQLGSNLGAKSQGGKSGILIKNLDKIYVKKKKSWGKVQHLDQ